MSCCTCTQFECDNCSICKEMYCERELVRTCKGCHKKTLAQCLPIVLSADSRSTIRPLSRWIDVRERPPEHETEVSVANESGLVTSAYLVKTCEGDKFFKNGERLYNVTHWMPLPEPPK